MNINGIDCKILKKEGKKATIEIEGQELIVENELLPLNIGVGESIKLHFLKNTEADGAQKKIAQSILEEILNGN